MSSNADLMFSASAMPNATTGSRPTAAYVAQQGRGQFVFSETRVPGSSDVIAANFNNPFRPASVIR